MAKKSPKYSNIEGNQEAAAAMRAQRKASRGRFVGGGFGVGGAMKGMATAGALNMGAGLAHSAANLAGNAISAINASMEKKDLYNSQSTKNTLIKGMTGIITEEYNQYSNLISENECLQPCVSIG